MPHAIILASASQSRHSLLSNAGVNFEAVPAAIDERAVEKGLPVDATPAAVALCLARAKALDVAGRRPEALVIGCDQTMSLEGELLHKVADLGAAQAQLMRLSGRTHRLTSALAVARDGAVVWETAVAADMTCRAYSEAFVADYLMHEGERVLSSVGCYQLEGYGIRLFERIEGDFFTILGLPLLPLLEALRSMGAIDG